MERKTLHRYYLHFFQNLMKLTLQNITPTNSSYAVEFAQASSEDTSWRKGCANDVNKHADIWCINYSFIISKPLIVL